MYLFQATDFDFVLALLPSGSFSKQLVRAKVEEEQTVGKEEVARKERGRGRGRGVVRRGVVLHSMGVDMVGVLCAQAGGARDVSVGLEEEELPSLL